MRNPSLLALVAVLGIAASSSAGQAATQKSYWAAGHLERADATSRTLVIRQGSHEMTFSLAANARLAQGTTPVSLDALSSDAGRSVKVEYHLDGAARTATFVEIGPAVPGAKGSEKPKPAGNPSR
jgi:hypothetical protein